MFPLSVNWPSPALQTLMALLYVVLAASVTADVLLKKSDVRAALGWIAAAWLSPIFGSLFYYLFGINRVTRRALKMHGLGDPQARIPHPAAMPKGGAEIALLAQAGERVTDSPLMPGNGLTILQGGDEAYPAMLDAIAKAQRCIAMASYIFRDDDAGRRFCDALIAAHRRGVQVRVLLDGVGSGYVHSGVLERLRAGGVPTGRFLHSWFPWRMPFLNMRNHRKLLVVDGAAAFLGGMNIARQNCDDAAGRRTIDDMHFRLNGPAVRPVMDAFARDWAFTTDEDLDQDMWWPALEETGPVFSRGLRSGPDADIYRVEMILGAMLSLARNHVRIVTPYFLPDQRLQFAIAQAALRGVRVDIVLPERSDQTVMQWAMQAHLRFFNHTDAHFHATPPPFDHSKLATMDGTWCLIGSSNWDMRSFRLNFEFDLECYDPALVAKLDAIIDGKIARGKKLSPQALAERPRWIRLRDAAARLLMPYL